MLTRLEINNFKNLVDFSIDFGPLTCIAGPNGSGKSNVFDAIRFLSLLSSHTILDAVLGVRGGSIETSDISDIFSHNGRERSDVITIAAEMIVDPEVIDDFGRGASASSTYLRYELELRYREAVHQAELGRVVLQREELSQITEGDAARRLMFPHSAGKFRRAAVRNSRRAKSGFISTESAADGQREILVHQDGGSRGQPQRAPAESAPRTIVSTSNTSTTPTILAAKREMESWRIVALEPSGMRRADRFHDPRTIDDSGKHLAGTLFKLANREEEQGGSRESLYARIANRVGELVPVSRLTVDVDEVRQLMTLQATEASGLDVPSRSLSDGTLRFLALAIIAEDLDSRGLICMEEPENGIHPAKLHAMVDLLRDLAFDASDAVSPDNPMRQLIIATHSPGVVQLQNPHDIVFMQSVVLNRRGEGVKTVRAQPLAGSWRARQRDVTAIGKASILAYLSTAPGAQISLDYAGL